MNTTRVAPFIFLGTAIGQIRKGEDGFAIALLCMVAFVLLVDWVFAELRESDRRKREQQRRESR